MKHISRLFVLSAIITFSLLAVQISHAETSQKILLAFGDSLTAGYGISLEKSFPAQLEKKLSGVKVVNAGVSGDTTSGGLARLAWTLEEQKPDFVILELGANDMLRAVDPAVTYENLRKMLDILKERKIPVLLAGMKATPNLGSGFTGSYQKMYRKLSKKYDAVYSPFFLEGVAAHPDLLQEDGLHPNEKGVEVIVNNILPSVKKLLEKK